MNIAEAQGIGLPVIAVDAKYGPAFLIEDGISGYLVPHDDDLTFVSRLVAVLTDDNLAASLAAGARERAEKNLSQSAVSERWRRLLGELVGNSGSVGQ